MPERKSPTWRALSLVLLMLAAGCATNSPAPVVSPAPPIPPLPAEALQPPRPKECTPTCSAGLMKLRTELLNTLTKRASPVKPAPASTAR